jgi:hypothetical protein
MQGLHIVPSGILYTSVDRIASRTYQYVPVHWQHAGGIRQYEPENFTVVRTGMYWYIPVRTFYIPVRTFNKTRDSDKLFKFADSPRRDKIKVVQLLCMGYNVTRSNFKTTQV